MKTEEIKYKFVFKGVKYNVGIKLLCHIAKPWPEMQEFLAREFNIIIIINK